MRTLAIHLLLCAVASAYPGKDQEIQRFIGLQSKVLEIAKEHQQDPFGEGSADLKEEVRKKIEALGLEKLPSDQLYRLGIACSAASHPQTAGDQRWDLVFENVCWRCVGILSTRSGSEAANHLVQMKALFGRDAGPSLNFKEYIARQEKLTREHAAAGERSKHPNPK